MTSHLYHANRPTKRSKPRGSKTVGTQCFIFTVSRAAHPAQIISCESASLAPWEATDSGLRRIMMSVGVVGGINDAVNPNQGPCDYYGFKDVQIRFEDEILAPKVCAFMSS
jgi:hypothetical protein